MGGQGSGVKRKTCPECKGVQIIKTNDGLKPCPRLAVTTLGNFACRLPDGTFETKREGAQVSNAKMQKDKAYRERNEVVAALAKAVLKLGGKVGRRKTDIPDWNPAWAWAIDIVAPGQKIWSWHYHSSHSEIFESFPLATWNWDGTDTPTKYKLMEEWKP